MIQSSTREREVTRAKDIISVLSDACYRQNRFSTRNIFFVVKKISTKAESIQTNIFLGVSCKGNYLEILDTGKTPCQSAIINYLSFLVNNYRPKSFFFIGKRLCILAYVHNPCTNIKGFLFAQTLLPHLGAGITCFRLCMSVDSKETLGISFTEALCLLRHLIQITRRRKKGINTLMSKWGENGRDWLKSASILNHLFLPEPT